MAEKFLVTGALGCIGAWTVKRLVAEGVPVWTYDLPGEPHRLRLIMDDAALAKVNFIHGDITDAAAFEQAVAANGITHVVHLAALQVPFVRADPLAGARVNVVGTTVVLESVRRHKADIQGLVYASSVGVYGGPDLYPDGTLYQDSPQFPLNLYGVFKQANEGTARIYAQDWGVNSIGIRPACRPAARAGVKGAPVSNLGGTEAAIGSVVEAIDAAAPEMKGQITYNPEALALPPHVDPAPLEAAIGKLSWTPLGDGVRQTIGIFRNAIAAGKVNVDRILA